MSAKEVATLPERRASHLVYGSGPLELDLALQPRNGSGCLEVNGALLDRHNGGLGRVPAYLLSGSRIVDEAMTDRRGSFHMATRAEQELRLCLLLEDDRMLEVELARLASPKSSWAMRPTSRSS